MVDTSGPDRCRNEVICPDMEEGDAGVRELQVGNADRSDDLRFGEKIQGLLLLRSSLAFECHTVVTGSLAGNCLSDSSDQSFTAITFRDHFGPGD